MAQTARSVVMNSFRARPHTDGGRGPESHAEHEPHSHLLRGHLGRIPALRRLLGDTQNSRDL